MVEYKSDDIGDVKSTASMSAPLFAVGRKSRKFRTIATNICLLAQLDMIIQYKYEYEGK